MKSRLTPTEARKHFPLVQNTRYFMTNSLGAMPDTVPAALAEMCRIWCERGANAWDEWAALPGVVGDQAARLIGAPASSVMMHLNVSSLLAQLLTAIDFRASKRNKILVSEMDFPTLHFLADAWQRFGARLEVVPSRDGIGVDLSDWERAIDGETRLILTCQVFFGSSYLQDIGRIVKLAQAKGAETCADLYQSAGSVPSDVGAWGVEYAVGGSHKYFCGGTGAAYLYVRPDLQKGLKPAATGWLSHADPFVMKPGPMQWAEGATKWMGGTPSVAPLYVAPCGMRMLEEIGIPAIREESLRQTQRLIEGSDRLGLEVRSPRRAEERGGSVHVRFPGVEGSQSLLEKKGYLVHYRPSYQGLRISPHFYNNSEEIDGLLQAIDEVRKSLEKR